MKPYFQGQVDVFCAIYAAINALALSHSIGAGQARFLLHEAILHMSLDREKFIAQLEQQIEYYDLVDTVLDMATERFSLYKYAPFGSSDVWPNRAEELWGCFSSWLNKPRRAVILRFVRPLSRSGNNIRHWSCAEKVSKQSLKLFDCSLDENAIYEIKYSQLCLDLENLSYGQVYIDPFSLRYVGVLP